MPCVRQVHVDTIRLSGSGRDLPDNLSCLLCCAFPSFGSQGQTFSFSAPEASFQLIEVNRSLSTTARPGGQYRFETPGAWIRSRQA
jgi:hypothetical protein